MSYKRLKECRCRGVSQDSPKLWEDIAKQTELSLLVSMSLRNESDRKRLVIWRLFGERPDSAFVFFFDRDFRCVKILCVCWAGIRLEDSYAERIVRCFSELGAAYYAVAHNHVDEPMSPSPDDIVLTRTLVRISNERLAGSSVFLGHYITDGFETVKINL